MSQQHIILKYLWREDGFLRASKVTAQLTNMLEDGWLLMDLLKEIFIMYPVSGFIKDKIDGFLSIKNIYLLILTISILLW